MSGVQPNSGMRHQLAMRARYRFLDVLVLIHISSLGGIAPKLAALAVVDIDILFSGVLPAKSFDAVVSAAVSS